MLFSDVKQGDRCSDPECLTRKPERTVDVRGFLFSNVLLACNEASWYQISRESQRGKVKPGLTQGSLPSIGSIAPLG
jgi:hypothetical protein